jgi:hypothetical protein
MRKNKIDGEYIVDFCAYCKEEILNKDAYFHEKNDKFYHKSCFFIVNEIPLELENDEPNLGDENTNTEDE